ncbi:MAG: toxin-antitoxin system YwqK family antitoxin [Candidatus Nucleicultricaceae bacterium]
MTSKSAELVKLDDRLSAAGLEDNHPLPKEMSTARKRVQEKLQAKRALREQRLEKLKNKTTDSSPKPIPDGIVQKTRKNGKAEARLTYHANKLNGVSEFYDAEGRVEKRLTYQDGTLNGDALYYESGLIRSKAHYNKGRIEGNLEIYKKGQLVATLPHVDGVCTGIACLYEGSGRILSKVTYKNGKRNGPCLSYNALGTVVKAQNFVDNKVEGEVKVFYPDGRLLMEYHVKDNKKEGTLIQYHKNGEIRRIEHYSNGKLLAPPRTYTSDGSEILDS